jgi:ABC-type transport system involved in multi-copper enzyme maturation permease subunit
MFGSMEFEHDPLGFSDLPAAIMNWTQVVGALSMVGVFLWLLFGLPFLRRSDRDRIPVWQFKAFFGAVILAAILYVVFGFIALVVRPPAPDASGGLTKARVWYNVFLTAAGACALCAALVPLAGNLPTLRLRRIWGLTRLTFKEAIRRRLLYALSVLLILFLFYGWFGETKPEAQLRNYVQFVFWVMTWFFLIIAVILAAFSIPTDIKQQTIQTIVTKPVERFEIVLGRFFGYVGVLSLLMFLMATLSLLYVVRGVDPDAADETLKAREPVYGGLAFQGTGDVKKGENVGREWDYRTYISGPMPGQQTQYAVWSFDKLPGKLADRQTVRCEFTFDVYRTTKGDENAGIRCALEFMTWRFQRGDEVKYRADRKRLPEEVKYRADRKRLQEEGKSLEQIDNELAKQIDNELAEQYGYYEIPSTKVVDYHTMDVQVPGGLFKNAAQEDNTRAAELKRLNQPVVPLQVRARCLSVTQYLGMAKYDMYFRADDPEGRYDRLWFAWNFYKAGFGLWLRMCLVTALAVVLSTYLSGVISLIVTGVLYLLGLAVDFLQEVSSGKNAGGGPLEALQRLMTRSNIATPLEENAATKITTRSDDAFRYFLRLLLNVIPDVGTSDLMAYVAKGFNIGPGQTIVACVLMFGYLFPWFLLGYYLMKIREIASAA